MEHNKEAFRKTGSWFWFGLVIWTTNMFLSIGLRSYVLELYTDSGYRAVMGHPIWLAVPAIAIALIIGSRFPFLNRTDREGLRDVSSIIFSVLGIVFLLIWFLQLVVDVGKK